MKKTSGMEIVMAVVLMAAAAGAAQAQDPVVPVTTGSPAGVAPDPQNPKEEDQEAVPQRPPRGLFGGSWGQKDGVAFMVTMFGEYSNDLRAASDDYPVRSVVQRSGSFTGMMANLTYDRRTPKTTLAFRGAGSGRYYPDLQEYSVPRYQSEVDFLAYLNSTRSSRLRVGQRLDYQPYYTLPIAGALVTPALDQIGLGASREDHLVPRESYISSTNATYMRDLGTRTSLTVDGGYRFTYSADPTFDVKDLNVNGRVLHKLAANFGLRGGAGYRIGTLPSTALINSVRGQDVDFGVEYSKGLSKMRRATFIANVGASVLESGAERTYRMTTNGSVRYDMPDRWSLQVDYDRGFRIIEGFADPFFSNGLMTRLTGFIGPRIEASIELGGSAGQVGFEGRTYRNFQGAAQVRYAFTRHIAVEAQGLAYQYDFDEGTPLGAGVGFIPRASDRRGGRVAVVFWLPISR